MILWEPSMDGSHIFLIVRIMLNQVNRFLPGEGADGGLLLPHAE